MNILPFISATSTRRCLPPAISLAASPRSLGMPRSRAKWLSVPKGSTPSTVSVPASAEAAALIVPSPPPTITKGSPRLAMVLQRTAQSPPPMSVSFASIPAARNASATLSAIFLSAVNAPPSRFSRTGTGLALALFGRALSDAVSVDPHLHLHRGLGVRRLEAVGHPQRVAVGRIGAGHLHRLGTLILPAVHDGVDLSVAHGEMLVAARIVPAGEEIFLRPGDVVGGQASLEILRLPVGHHRLHALRHVRRHARHLELLDRDLGLPQARPDKAL